MMILKPKVDIWKSAILFLYKEVLGVDLSNENITGIYQLVVTLMFGCGLRMSEVLNIYSS